MAKYMVLSSLLVFGLQAVVGKQSVLQKLRYELLKDYDKFVRPVHDYRNVTVLGVGLSPVKLIKLDEEYNEMILEAWLQLTWKDQNLVWNPRDFDGIETFNMPVNDIWQPDISPYRGQRKTIEKMQEMYAIIYYDGGIMWVPSGRLHTQCTVKYSQFPKNKQMCTITIGSWTFNGLNLDLQPKTPNLADLINDNPHWEVTKVTADKVVKHYNCCVEPFPVIKFNLSLERRLTVNHYLSKTLRVASEILFLSMFWLPTTQKMLMGCIALFCCTVYAAHTAWTVTSPALAPFALSPVTAEFAVGLAAIIVQVIIINVSQPKKYATPKIFNFLTSGMGKALSCIHNESKTKGLATTQPNGVIEPLNGKEQTKDSCYQEECFRVSTVIDRILFVVFAVIFIVVSNYF